MHFYLALPCTIAAALAITAASAGATQPVAPSTTVAADIGCHFGAYAMSANEWILLLRSNSDGSTFRYVRSDGEYGQLDNSGGGVFVEAPPRPPMTIGTKGCDDSEISVAIGETAPRIGHRLPFDEEVLSISSDGLTLAGKLVLPADGAVRQIVIWVDGSDQDASIDSMDWQYVLPMNGIGVFMLDKRGTGASGGAPTANFHERAQDVVAAVEAVRRRIGPEVGIGLLGASQGGWVAPLAATLTPTDFVVVTYGMAEGVPAEDRDEIIQDLQAAGYGEAEIAKAMELQAAATAIAKSHWTTGWEAFDALKARYATEPWYAAAGTDGYTGMMLRTPSEQVRVMGPQMDLGISFEYDPMPVIEALETRQLWVLGGADTSAPSARTRELLEGLKPTHPGIDVAVFPNADHGIVETQVVDGVQSRRRSAGYWALVVDWIRTGHLSSVRASAS